MENRKVWTLMVVKCVGKEPNSVLMVNVFPGVIAEIAFTPKNYSIPNEVTNANVSGNVVKPEMLFTFIYIGTTILKLQTN